jgi:DNA-binding XRE family transcriptional regulator
MDIKERKKMYHKRGRPLGSTNMYLPEDIARRKFLGRKLKRRRRQVKKTQTEVGIAVGVTFQQIQKYEKGTNAITTLRLEPLRIALDIPVHKVGYLINKYNPKQKTV